MVRLIPFILGILAGYAVAAVFTLIGNATATDALKVLDFSKLSVLWENGVTLKTFVNYELVTKDFVFLKAAKGFAELNWGYVSAIAVAYVRSRSSSSPSTLQTTRTSPPSSARIF